MNGRAAARSGEWAQHFFQMLLVLVKQRNYTKQGTICVFVLIVNKRRNWSLIVKLKGDRSEAAKVTHAP